MRSALTTSTLVVALLVAGAGTAVARPDVPAARIDAAQHARAVRSLVQEHRLTVADASPLRTQVVHVTRAPLADGGFEWADAGIGAGFAVALVLSAAGISAARRNPPMTTR